MTDPSFTAELAPADGTTVLRLRGELDLSGVEQAQMQAGRLLEQLTPGERFVVDLSELTFCDSSGIRALMQIRADALAAGKKLLLSSPTPPVRRVFELAGVDLIFEP